MKDMMQTCRGWRLGSGSNDAPVYGSLRLEIVEGKDTAFILDGSNSVLVQQPSQPLGFACGVEDCCLQKNGYGGAQYGWDEAVERFDEQLPVWEEVDLNTVGRCTGFRATANRMVTVSCPEADYVYLYDRAILPCDKVTLVLDFYPTPHMLGMAVEIRKLNQNGEYANDGAPEKKQATHELYRACNGRLIVVGRAGDELVNYLEDEETKQ